MELWILLSWTHFHPWILWVVLGILRRYEAFKIEHKLRQFGRKYCSFRAKSGDHIQFYRTKTVQDPDWNKALRIRYFWCEINWIVIVTIPSWIQKRHCKQETCLSRDYEPVKTYNFPAVPPSRAVSALIGQVDCGRGLPAPTGRRGIVDDLAVVAIGEVVEAVWNGEFKMDWSPPLRGRIYQSWATWPHG